VVLYARWTTNPTYTVTYNGNLDTGGSVPVDLNHYETGTTVTVLGNSGNLVKAHFQFAGWCTNADGTGDCFAPGETFDMGSASVLLYAHWTPNPTYMVTYDGNGQTGGSAPVDGARYEPGDVVMVPGNSGGLVTDQQQDGITLVFNCWNTAADGSGDCYEGGDTFLMGGAEVTLYAHYSVIRAIGPAGGWVFFDKGDYDGGWRYLESSPSDNGTQVQWFNGVYTHTSALGQAVGDGASNTPLIVASQGLPGPTESDYAALICSDLVVNAFDDWFLPSMDELDWMYENLQVYGVGGFAPHGYWSSSEFEDDHRLARNQYFVTGGQGYDLKDWLNDVRCVHAFSSF
jgi:uncharacterized repeat protein (TIGR02543 family)